jgi:hypothetical protein
MKRLCLTCKNKGCVHLCRFHEQSGPKPRLVQLKG